MGFLMGCENVHLEYPVKLIFDNLTLGIEEGDRMGIVGSNGDGKTSLLQLLARTVEPDSGRITARNGLRVGYLQQHDSLDPDATVAHSVVGDVDEHEWASDPRVRGIINGIIGDVPWDGLVRNLSGGQRRRVDIARVLVGDHDVILLDEPTNHLDMRAIAWLAAHLQQRWNRKEGALLVVTHDRWFLDEVCTAMLEIHDGIAEPFEGGFSAYVLQKVERERAAEVAWQKHNNLMRRELAWLTRGARARATKPKFHMETAKALIATEPPIRNTIELKRSAMSRLGKQVIDVMDVSASYDGVQVIDGVTWHIGAGDRYGILGENGAGKTTLLRLIMGKQRASKGYVKIGKTVKFAYLSQELEGLRGLEDDRVREVLGRYKTRYEIEGKELTPAQLLERLGFETSPLNSRVRDLSGGQRRRLMLMLILLDHPTVLVLDEPGNDLDTQRL
ncbi:MAG: ABC-F family ATP-binding cassette domain-containing protein, partial [Coriobacteriales bacterium]|nr:ABC-F family ATP-binding cassette domain-containing protein [Coriobacteriales bacterium]